MFVTSPTRVRHKRGLTRKSQHIVLGLLLAAFLFTPAVLPTTAFAQQDDDRSVKQNVKDAAHSTKEAAKKTGKKVKRGTKKVVNKSATKTADTADKVAGKTKP